jgi:putative ABC transport system permease protein
MRNEIRYALRALSRDRAFAAMVVLSLAVGIGANTAIFSLVNGVLLRPLAYRDPDRLVAIDQIVPKLANLYPALPVNLAILFEWRKQATSLESIGVMMPASVNLSGAGEPELLAGARVSANIFAVLGVQPRLGRSFMEGEDPAGHDRVAILADSLWRRRFHSDPAIVGRKILLNGLPHEVVGVLPPSFRFPTGAGFAGFSAAAKTEVFRPLGYENDNLRLHMGDFNYWVTARLRSGVSISKARAELNVVQAAISAKIPEDHLDLHASIVPLQERMVGDVRQGLLLLMAAVGAVLMILWVNLANLSLVRAAGRARDAAIRTALGASRARLLRQSLAESLLLALTGGALGVALAYGGLRALLAAAPIDLPRLNEVHVDLRVLLFALAVSLAAGAVLGILPALRSAAAAPYESLKSGSRTNTEGRRGLRIRNLLVSLEVGLSATLLVTAGLLIASFVRVMTIDKGFDVERVIALDMSLPSTKYPNDAPRAAFFRRVLDKAAAMPGVQSLALVSALPLEGETWIDIVGTEHDPRPLLEKPSTNVRFISPGYFQTLRIPLRDGRDFQEQDQKRKVVIISAGLAQRLWPGQNPVGRKLDNGSDAQSPMEVIGVTPDVRSTSLDHDPVNMMYIPYWQWAQRQGSLLVRTAMDPRGIAAALRSAVWAVDSEVPIPEVRTLEQVMERSVAQRRFQVMLVVLFAAAALALAAFGTYGVVSYGVARRRAEMGIRMALGATRSDVLKMVLRQGMMPVLAGLAAGAMAALVIGRSLASLLFQVSPRDPTAFIAAGAVLLLVSVAACLVPARRATQVNPTDALRFE